MENVTDQVRNPFGMRPPCSHPCDGATGHTAVLGYGDANADFHVIGDHPGVHGGGSTGIPFTDHPVGTQLMDVLETVGFVTPAEAEDAPLRTRNCFLSYRYCCCLPANRTPTEREYQDFDRFFDAELRAIAADVLVPVGAKTTHHVIGEYTAKAGRLSTAMDSLHGTQVRGRGFLVLPVKDPSDWMPGDRERIIQALEDVLSVDYHQMVDLGRFLPGGDPYYVR